MTHPASWPIFLRFRQPMFPVMLRSGQLSGWSVRLLRSLSNRYVTVVSEVTVYMV